MESYLTRRIVRYQTNIDDTLENGIRQLIDENAINPKDSYRIIPNLVLCEIQGFTDTLKMQITYDNLYDVIVSLCQSYGYGFKITLENGNLVFNLYKGADHSYSQDINPYVVFSPEFDNLINSHYITDKQDYKNYAYVFGEGEGSSRSFRAVSNKLGYIPKNLELYELYVDAKDLSTNDGEIGTQEYGEMLYTRGIEKLSECNVTTAFEGEVNSNLSYQYKKDYNLGDIVQVTNEYGITTKARITEIIESESDSGTELVPTFEYEEEE
ncbi:MAG: siphovirus ReqiPepy6 Gp37-like family protein [Ruminococcus sp.]|nr:siphovirus ReqiPepy6 Gp37-like family protein [Ruminococcus sp.]